MLLTSFKPWNREKPKTRCIALIGEGTGEMICGVMKAVLPDAHRYTRLMPELNLRDSNGDGQVRKKYYCIFQQL